MSRLACLAAALGAAAAAAPGSGPWPAVEPFWPHYPTRRVTVLNGTWQFGYVENIDPVTIPYSQISTPNTTTVPGSFDVTPPGILGPRGNAFFRSFHQCTPGMTALLKFYAVNFYARVFVDGAEIGNHTAGGYTPFQMLAPACQQSGTRELVVVVNNQQNYTTAPTFTGGDFYFYSGIIRPVVVTEFATSQSYWLDRVEPITKNYQMGTIDIRVVIGGTFPPSLHLSYGFNGGPLSAQQEVVIAPNGDAIISNVPVPDFQLWSVGRPNLYTLQVYEAVLNDSIIVRSGIRAIGVDPATSRVTINGEIVKLLGFNRHTMYPDTGAAVTQEQEAADVALLKQLNANYVRGAHYPQSQSFLDLLDENGIVLWEETLGPGTSTGNMNDPYFMTNHLQAVASMVGTSFAHPSVIIHAFFNEGPSQDPKACVGYQASSDLIKSRTQPPDAPPMRLVTWANDHTTTDVCIQYEDVISFNSYPGWYGNPGNVSYPAVEWGSYMQWVEQNWPTKPFFVSETGGAGVLEWANDTLPFPGVPWTQAYQRNLLQAEVSFLANATRMTGLTIWQFADIKANDAATRGFGQCVYAHTGGWPNDLSIPWTCAFINATQGGMGGRPGGENHKGSVDFWRRKKEAFDVVSAIFATGGK